jgi:hypothetical protein
VISLSNLKENLAANFAADTATGVLFTHFQVVIAEQLEDAIST